MFEFGGSVPVVSGGEVRAAIRGAASDLLGFVVLFGMLVGALLAVNAVA